jgi:hypothetical protein
MKRFVPFLAILFFMPGSVALHAQLAIINEFMFSPATGAAEWVELFNPTDTPVNLRGWTISDRSGGTAVLSSDDCIVQPGEYIVIAQSVPIAPGWEQLPCAVLRPSSFPSLNNSGDDIVIRNAEGHMVDSLSYTASWSSQRGCSAERIRCDSPPLKGNFAASTAAAGGTPGALNTASAESPDPFPRFTLIFNEIMDAPLPSSCEWIELYNPGADSVDLSRWALAGKANSKGERTSIGFPAGSGKVRPGGYALIAADSSVLQNEPQITGYTDVVIVILGRASLDLGNGEDEVLLLDPSAAVVDSVWYSEDWHHPFSAGKAGVSLELMHPAYHQIGGTAWSSCADPSGGTPGRRNSIHTEAPPGSAAGATALSVAPNPFSPDGDGFEDSCLLRCTLPENVNQVRVRLYDAEGRVIATLRNNAPMGREGLVVWDGFDDAGRMARMGCYVALLEALDPASNIVVAAKAVVVLARRL